MRTKRALLNSAVSLASKALLMLGGFLLQRVMTRVLGQQNIGLGSVCANVVSILSLAELGFASAIVYNLYAPLARHDETAVRALMTLFAKAYRVVACVVAVLGLALMPLVPSFLKDGNFDGGYVRLIYGLYLLKTVCGYFFAYQRSLLMADQKAYQIALVDLATQLASIALGIAVLALTGSFAAYLALTVAATVLSNLAIALLARRQYPGLRRQASEPALEKQVQKTVFSNVKNVFLMRLSGVVLSSTDALIISSFVGVMAAGTYANYALLTTSVLGLIGAVTNALQATLGHMVATETGEHMDGVLKSDTFLYYLIGTGVGLCLMCASNVFVGDIWLSRSYLLPPDVVCLLMGNVFLLTLRSPLWSLLTVSGLFAKDRNISLLGALSNLIISLALVGCMGIAGVVVGTLVSQGLQVVLKTRLLYRDGLRVSAKGFSLQLCSYFLLFAAQSALCLWLCSLVEMDSSWLLLLLKVLICLGVETVVNLPMCLRSKRAAALKFSLRQALGWKETTT